MRRSCGTKIYLGSRHNRRYIDCASYHLIKDLATLPPADVTEDPLYTVESDVTTASVHQSPYSTGRYKVVSDETGGRLVALHVDECTRGRLWLEDSRVYHPNSLAVAEVVEERVDNVSAFHLLPSASYSNIHVYKRTLCSLQAWDYLWKIEFREVYTAPEITEPLDEYLYFTEAIRYQVILSCPDPQIPLEVVEQVVTLCTPSIFGRFFEKE